MVNTFSREQVEGSLHGRVDSQVLREVFREADEDARFLSVGTKPMMKQTSQMLEDIGFPMPRHALLAKV
jgi:NAD(P)H-flavin reductase